MLALHLGAKYGNRRGSIVKIVRSLDPKEPNYHQGFRFEDDQQRTYKADGCYNFIAMESDYDLVTEYNRGGLSEKQHD